MKSTTDDRSALETSKRVREASALLLLALAGYFFLSLWGYDADDPSWANARDSSLVSNWGGIVGAWLAYTLYFAFGYIAVVLSLFATKIKRSSRPEPAVKAHWLRALLSLIHI